MCMNALEDCEIGMGYGNVEEGRKVGFMKKVESTWHCLPFSPLSCNQNAR